MSNSTTAERVAATRISQQLFIHRIQPRYRSPESRDLLLVKAIVTGMAGLQGNVKITDCFIR